MIFDQILFHNVEELEETEKGYLLRRVCKKVRDGISDGVQNNRFATGVELRPVGYSIWIVVFPGPTFFEEYSPPP